MHKIFNYYSTPIIICLKFFNSLRFYYLIVNSTYYLICFMGVCASEIAEIICAIQHTSYE